MCPMTTLSRLGRGLAKMDIKQEYRNMLVHPEDQLLFGMLWERKVYVVSFGLRSAPLIFTAVAAMDHESERLSLNSVSYIAGAPCTPECQMVNADIMHQTCKEVGLPTKPEKPDEGPATVIPFLDL